MQHSNRISMPQLPTIIASYLFFVNLIAFVLYVIDKKKAYLDDCQSVKVKGDAPIRHIPLIPHGLRLMHRLQEAVFLAVFQVLCHEIGRILDLVVDHLAVFHDGNNLRIDETTVRLQT